MPGSPGSVVSDAFDVEPPYEFIRDAELPDHRFLDRELSWLHFNQRVLELAEDPHLPLLERVRFMAIFASNLDEFFMVRVAGLKRRIAAGVAVRAASGLLPREVLESIWSMSRDLMERNGRLLHKDVLPALSEQGIELLRWDELTPAEREKTHGVFRDRVFPVLTPLAVDPAHPFPYISGLSLNLAVMVRNPQTRKEHFARVKVPPIFRRFVPVGGQRFVPLEDIIAAHLEQLFPGMEIVQHHAFRVTRNEDLDVEEDDAENLLQALERELLRRRFGPPVRLEVEETIDPHVLELLVSELDVTAEEVFHVPGPLDLTGLNGIADLDRAELKYPAFLPKTHPHLAEVESASPADMFAALRQRDVLVQHPYDSFSTSVQRFLEQAAADPHVLAIKQTLYRTSGDSPIIDALVDAAQSGKQVLVLVEIKARFDEEANIRWARKLEQSGCHVVYGLMGLKTHSKLLLVVRDEPEGIRRYAHVGTGNYNPKTARLYEDLGLLTADPQITADISHLFNNLSGFGRTADYRRLLVAPDSVRSGLVDRIHDEIRHHRAGRPAGIRMKLNSLVDEAVIDALYRASQAGVPVGLWVRGICGLQPGVPGMSEAVRVRSVLGRFLEHSRIFWFENGGEPHAWIGSADLMHRNLDRRVEVLVQIPAAEHVEELGRLLDLGLSDETASWHLHGDGSWTRHHHDADGHPLRDLHEELIAIKRRRRQAATAAAARG
ncbi:MAG TPA: RNA degradosome polyphosphate kinase [Nocardioidaceae bacterium]|nr:RNA degradosome polyphosphate kinase [Nocardioidaceae bacterium]